MNLLIKFYTNSSLRIRDGDTKPGDPGQLRLPGPQHGGLPGAGAGGDWREGLTSLLAKIWFLVNYQRLRQVICVFSFVKHFRSLRKCIKVMSYLASLVSDTDDHRSFQSLLTISATDPVQCVTNTISRPKYEYEYIWVNFFWQIQIQIYLDPIF